VDCDDRIIPVEFSGEQVLQLQVLQVFSEAGDIILQLPEEKLSPFFIKNAD